MTDPYSAAKRRNVKRHSAKHHRKMANARAAQERKRLESGDVREPAWSPPELRRLVVIIDLDSGRPLIRMAQLWRGDRIDTYRVRTPRGESRRDVGWSRVLAAVRKGMPRSQKAPL